MKRLLLTALLLAPAPALAQTASPVSVFTPAPVSDEAIYVAYPPATYAVAFDHVLLEGSVKPGATLSIGGRAVEVGADGLFIEWVPLTRGENVLRLESTLAGVTSARELKVTSTPPTALSGAAQIVPGGALPTADRVAYLLPQTPEARAVPLAFSGTPGAQASFRVGDLGPFPMAETAPGRYEGTFLLPERLAAAPVTYTLTAPDGSTATASSAGRLSVTGTGPRVAEVTAAIPGRGVQAGTSVWRNGAGRNYVVYPRTGARTVVVGEDGNTFVVQASGTLTLNAPKTTLTLLPEGTPLPRAVSTNIDVKRSGDHSEVRIGLPQKVPFTVEQNAAPGGSASLDLRLFHSVADVDYIVSAFPDPAVRDVRWTQDADGVARVHVDLVGRPWGYDATYEGNTLVLRVRQAPAVDDRQPLRGRTVVIDPGHGGDELGGAGPLRVPEKGMTLPIALRVAELLREKGAAVILTRETDVTVPIYNRPLLAEEKNAELLVSIHANALPDGVDPATRRGSGVYYYQPQARALADALQGSLVEKLPDIGNDGVHYQNLALTRPTTQLSVLVETAYLTDKGNLRQLMSGAGRERFAQAIAQGIERFYRGAATGR
ncbi:N-acetylmuramoyl-L-alanine amidase [Deinococcus sp. Leaf326]|uniref:N-acetylmuramoyl-L-alanine amidase family protein n=1 Tax=Deinococcus sp. Leaf326 TaxID=1736338 RepID=UPI0006F610DA|nr:N-acetylmuramoyl-L-alanine amidase [Deinococcus sp. Leaf326]KQR41112.1 N-acetylmuramoyl-L-alanine amidase [Deinococcus sp. Leaf326]